MIKKVFKIARNNKIIILFFIAILSIVTIKLLTSGNQSNQTYIIGEEDNEGDEGNKNLDSITLNEESLLGEWEFDTNIQNKAYSKPSKIKLNFQSNSDVIVDTYLLDHGDYLTDSSGFKYKIEKDKKGENYIGILFNVDSSQKENIDSKYSDCMFKFIIKKIEKDKIDVELEYTSKESKKERLEGSLIKLNKNK
ncbi:hypothetical protein CLOBI_08440 [Clostridium beijerinckii]|uniref:hypothetical protein n=1 Tax=Clostridium beijerinckii TaxID=1520 RepID=UPI00098C42F3|nr:hypothetical protein [Clostridium beijerinckii]OOM66212.1 hypothetical protein CLOBI_08440 [Clostridium beijerinckii]